MSTAEVTVQRTGTPRFGFAVVAVLAAAALTSWCSTIFATAIALFGRDTRYLLLSFVGAWAVKFVIRIFGYEISYLVAVVALLVGAAVAMIVRGLIPHGIGPSAFPVFPAFGAVATLPSILVSALVVQYTAEPARRWREVLFGRR